MKLLTEEEREAAIMHAWQTMVDAHAAGDLIGQYAANTKMTVLIKGRSAARVAIMEKARGLAT